MNVEGKIREVNIQVVPFKIQATGKFWYLVIFDETTKGLKPGVLPRALAKTDLSEKLKTQKGRNS